jgi:hypothetical protein
MALEKLEEWNEADEVFAAHKISKDVECTRSVREAAWSTSSH